MRRYQQAFTIIELMVTLVVLAIVVGLAVPSFNTLIQNNRSVALGEELVTAINFARAEALKRSNRVSICASSNGVECAGSWTDGWIVVVDSAASDGAVAPVITAPATDVLRAWGAFDPNAIISEANNKTFIRYTGTGILGRVDNNSIVFTSKLQNCSGTSARNITIGLSGSPSVSPVECNQAETEDE